MFIKNNDIISHAWSGQDVNAGEYYNIQPNEEVSWSNNSALLTDIANGIAIVSKTNDSGGHITDVNSAIDYLKNKQPIETTPLTPKNEHTMQAWGCTKGHFTSSNNACPITLSNKSQDGLTFSYNANIPIVPSIGNYVFQDSFSKRSWIVSVDTQNYTVTFDLPVLDNGTGHYSKGYYIDTLVRDWTPITELWGATCSAKWNNSHDGYDDFIELSIVDLNDLFLDDNVTQALFGVDAVDVEPYLLALGFEQNGEYNHWTKYYDESWIPNIINKQTFSPDGAPGNLLPNLYLRVSYFTSKQDTTENHFYIDYIATSKD